MSVKNVMRVLAGTAGVMLVAGAAGPGAAAVSTEDSGDVQAVVRKTVRQAGSAIGEISNSTMYTQISAVGNGTKTVTVPVGTTSNRNLNAFGPFPMEGESMVVELTVADGGGVEQRTVTDADINPMAVSVKVMLDGAEVAPEDLVGASGVLDVEYTVRNTTAKSGPVTFSDVEGKEITEDIETAEPFVGALDVVLPQGFNEITAPGATVAGNGQNQTQLGYTFVLFPPLGSAEVKVGYQARIGNGQMPAAEFSFLPIVPFDNSTIAGTTEAYKGGAATGAAIFGAGDQIGANLLKLQDGAGKLVAGLGQLSAGATQLNTGLDSAASGSQQLADGSAELSDGLNELDSNVPALEEGVSDLNAGAKKLNGGAQQVADGNAKLAEGADELNANVPALAQGVGDLNTGAAALSTGMAALNKGLADLYAGVEALPASVKAGLATNPDYLKLLGALDGIVKGIGSASTDGTLLFAVALVSAGIGTSPACNPTTGADCGLLQAIGSLQGLLGCPTTDAPAACAYVIDNPGTVTPPSPPDAVATQQTLVKMTKGIGSASADGTLLNGMKRIELGLSNPACDAATGANCGIQQAAAGVLAGIPILIDKILAQVQGALLPKIGVPTAGCDPKSTLRCASTALTAGAAALATGTSTLNSKVPALASGVSQLAAGADQLADGSAQVADGTETLAEGTETLNSKVPTLASGVNQLAAGGEQLAAGNEELAAGLTTAADGSGQLADGLSQAEPGGAQIEDGAGRLKKEGADELAKTGKEAQVGYARNVALLEAAQQAGLEGSGIPFGPAEGTDVVTTAAYKMYLSGIAADTENNALKFGLGALLIAGAGGAAFAASRKLSA